MSYRTILYQYLTDTTAQNRKMIQIPRLESTSSTLKVTEIDPYKVFATFFSPLSRTRQGPFHFSLTIAVTFSSPELSVFAIV